jgi:hypothetical protein
MGKLLHTKYEQNLSNHSSDSNVHTHTDGKTVLKKIYSFSMKTSKSQISIFFIAELFCTIYEKV